MKLVCQLKEEDKVKGEDWDSLMWHNGKLFSASYSNGNIKVKYKFHINWVYDFHNQKLLPCLSVT